MAKPFPVDHSLTSFWRSEPDPLDNFRSTESLPETSDIVIIGAGYAGASTAYHCLERSRLVSAEQPSIVILEARQACSGATGRNGKYPIEVIPRLLVKINAWRVLPCRWSLEA